MQDEMVSLKNKPSWSFKCFFYYGVFAKLGCQEVDGNR